MANLYDMMTMSDYKYNYTMYIRMYDTTERQGVQLQSYFKIMYIMLIDHSAVSQLTHQHHALLSYNTI